MLVILEAKPELAKGYSRNANAKAKFETEWERMLPVTDTYSSNNLRNKTMIVALIRESQIIEIVLMLHEDLEEADTLKHLHLLSEIQFVSVTKKFLQVEEARLAVDCRVVTLLERYSERVSMTAQASIALGEGLKALAEALKDVKM